MRLIRRLPQYELKEDRLALVSDQLIIEYHQINLNWHPPVSFRPNSQCTLPPTDKAMPPKGVDGHWIEMPVGSVFLSFFGPARKKLEQ